MLMAPDCSSVEGGRKKTREIAVRGLDQGLLQCSSKPAGFAIEKLAVKSLLTKRKGGSDSAKSAVNTFTTSP